MKVLQYPLTQITLFFVFGIVFHRYINVGFSTGLWLLAVTFLFFIGAFVMHYIKSSPLISKFFTTVSLLLSFTIGIFAAIFHQDTNDQKHYVHSIAVENGELSKLKIVLIERWKPTAKNERYVAEISHIDNQTTTGKILVNFRKDSLSTDLQIGMKLAIFAKIFPLQKPLNPDQFDYSSFLKNKSIFGQIYTDQSSIKVFTSVQKDAYYYSANFRNRVTENLRNSGLEAKELGVVQALLMGQRQDLDDNVLQNFQYAGAIHILSVSGLHVGFVLLFLNYFLKFLPNSNRFRIVKLVTIILLLWCFALVAGFSPSVVRSVTMFSFVAIGMFMRRKTYIFYTLYCSILIILLFEPSFLFDVGFQLSYLALFFILWLQPEFEKYWQPKNKIALHFWQVLTVTFAAQLGTMPLSLYYFHQFPGLFFLTNLLVMFLITVIMGVGLFLIVIAYWTVIPSFFVQILEKLILFLNYIVEVIASFESFLFKDIPFDFWMMIASFLVVFSLGRFIIMQSFRTSTALLVTVLICQISYFAFDFKAKNKTEFLVFQARNNTLLMERRGNEAIVFSNSLDAVSVDNDRNIQSFKVANGISTSKLQKVPNLIYFQRKKILVLDSSTVAVPLLKPEVILVTQSPRLNFDRILKDYHPQIVIVDASNYKNVTERIRKTCNQQKIPFHAVAEKGFYKIE